MIGVMARVLQSEMGEVEALTGSGSAVRLSAAAAAAALPAVSSGKRDPDGPDTSSDAGTCAADLLTPVRDGAGGLRRGPP